MKNGSIYLNKVKMNKRVYVLYKLGQYYWLLVVET